MNGSTPASPFDDLVDLLGRSKACEPAIAAAGELLVATFRAGGKVLTCGNGGSAAAALHLAEELLGRYTSNRRPLPAVCVNADPTALTCIANDFGFEQVFARQVTALASPGDVLVGFTTSGNSSNVLAAFAAARQRGAKTILLGGNDGGRARGACDIEVIIPSPIPARIQEVHTLVVHCWLDRIEGAFPSQP